MRDEFTCPKCGRGFKSERGLGDHYRKKHDKNAFLPPQTELEKYLHNQSNLNLLRLTEGDIFTITRGIKRKLMHAGFIVRTQKHPRRLKFTDKAKKLLEEMKNI